MMDKYILDDSDEPVKCDDLEEWAAFMEYGKRNIAKTDLPRFDCRISTVFLGLDHNFGDGEPLLFETMVFGGKHNEQMTRSTCIGDALMAHLVYLVLLTGGYAEVLEEYQSRLSTN